MSEDQDKINLLLQRMELLMKQQETFAQEIKALKLDLDKLQFSQKADAPTVVNLRDEVEKITPEPTEEPTEEIIVIKPIEEKAKPKENLPPTLKRFIPLPDDHRNQKSKKSAKSERLFAEKFIGENLLNKVGIIITIIGVAIGAKYSIEHDLVSPLTRIILGYISGFTLLGLGAKLKKKYHNYSAVLVSGAMCILYFITYSAYDFYHLIPNGLAFLLMVVFTVFTTVAAMNYDKQVIAHLGLVGAYAVPILLSTGSGRYDILFTYIAIINTGILYIAFKKRWRLLNVSAFFFTWIIFAFWTFVEYRESENFILSLVFSFIFFTIFYVTYLAFLTRAQKSDRPISLMIITNTFTYFGLGYFFLDEHEIGTQLLGLFSLFIALIHFAVSVFVHRQKMADKSLFYITAGLVLTFITMAIPIQLDGDWVTLLWVAEAALLYWLGKTKNIKEFERISYPIMILAFGSLLEDWGWDYFDFRYSNNGAFSTPLFNVGFLSSMLFVCAFAFINYIQFKYKEVASWLDTTGFKRVIEIAIPSILVFTLFCTFKIEINLFWDQLYDQSKNLGNDVNGQRLYGDNDLFDFKRIWVANYTLLFVSVLSFINYKKVYSKALAKASLILSGIAVLYFLTDALYAISELRESYLTQDLSEYYNRSSFNIYIRYISLAFLTLPFLVHFEAIKNRLYNWRLKKFFNGALHVTMIWVLSSELIHWMDMGHSEQSYKLGLSILWGLYSLTIIVYGIIKDIQYLRIGGIILFGITLAKLFFYDISHLNTLSKTIVFISLGALLLIISYLYNRFNSSISSDED